MSDDDTFNWEDDLAFLCPEVGALDDELPPQLAAATSKVGQMPDGEILEEIRRLLEGGSGTDLSPRARHLGLHILEKGWVTPSMERRHANQGEHVWQAKSELNQVIPVNSRDRHPGTNEAMYKFDLDQIRRDGRIIKEADITRKLTTKERREIEARHHHACIFCHDTTARLQIEHRIPFLIGGNYGGTRWLAVACAPCNRRKGFFCKQECPNWETSDPEVCKRCFWASPDDYDHTATKPQRVVLETFSDPAEVAQFEQARAQLSARDALLSMSLWTGPRS